MKNVARSLIQFSDYPLEPIVAQEVTKTYQTKIINSLFPSSTTESVVPIQTKNADKADNWDVDWFSNYE